MAEHSSGEIVGTFLVGTIIGGIAALLLAPASGRETREKIGEWMEENKDAAQKKMGEAKDAAWQKMGEVKDAAQKKIDELEAELKRRKEELAAEIRRRKAARAEAKAEQSETQTVVEDSEEKPAEESAA